MVVNRRIPNIAHPASHRISPYIQTILLLLALLSLAGLALVAPWAAQMQDGANPVLRITRLDTEKFPEVQVQVYGDNLGGPLAETPLTVREDGVEQAVLSREQVKVGTQTALVLDAAKGIETAGPSGEPRFVEAGLAARRLVELKLLSPTIDRLTTVSFGPDKKLAVLHPWSGDHQAVADSFYIYQPVADLNTTSLSDLILFASAQFGNDALAGDQERAIIVFSDGGNPIGNTEVIDAITDAQSRGIRIHAVVLGTPNQQQQRNMSRLATMTGGLYVEMTSIEALDDLWRTIADTSAQERLTYRSAKPDPRQVEVTAEMADGETLTADRFVPATNVQPVRVDIVAPAPGQVFERQGPAFDTVLNDLEPRTIDVDIDIAFLDKLPRAIQRVEYQVGNLAPVVRSEPPFDQPVPLSIETLGENDYGLRVRVVDELGLTGESNALPFRINEVRPPTPTVTPDAALIAQAAAAQERAETAQAEASKAQEDAAAAAEAAARANDEAQRNAETAGQLQTNLDAASAMLQRLSWVTIGSSVLAVAALGLAIYVLSSKDRRKRATEVITGTVKAVTEPFNRSGRKGGGAAAHRAKLSLVDGAGATNLPPTIPIFGGSLRIGRDPNLVNVVLEDRRISRLHCRITEEGGQFKVLDEGSTSGTYVNEAEVGMNGQVLQNGDVLGIGPVNYRLDVEGTHPKPSNGSSFENNKMYDNTEPYIKPPGR